MLWEVYLAVVRVVVCMLQLDVHLLQKVVKRLNQVVNEVELIVVH